jgi:hypothetical protein
MVQKDLRKYDLIIRIGSSGGAEQLRELAGIDFAIAIDMWEYKLTKDIDAFGNHDIFYMFETLSASKLRGALAENTVLLKLVYGTSSGSCSGANLGYLCDLIIGSKIAEAEEILKLVKSNPTGDFNERMKTVVDTVFEISMAKNGTKKASFNHKQTILLFDFVSKMKSSATKNLLSQRLKEL